MLGWTLRCGSMFQTKFLKDRKDATDVVRKAIEDVVADDNYKEKFIQAMADAYGVKLISDVTYRVGK